jgi:hypothetical protein
MCHAWNLFEKVEIGAVGEAEGGGLAGDADPTKYTDVEQAVDPSFTVNSFH